MSDKPISYQWDGEAMQPVGAAQSRLCDEIFVVGQRYTLIEQKQRSRATHDHYFACVAEAWQNMPDQYALHFPSDEHLRKHALVRCGYADALVVACQSAKDARKFARECKQKDIFAVVDLNGDTVTMWTAHSQSKKAMGKQKFAESKTKVLDWLAQTFGYDASDLGKAA